MHYSYPDIAGVILAGGRSSRFGSNKAYAHFAGVPLIVRTYETIRPLFSEIFLVTNTPDDYQQHPASVLQDDTPYLGPLGGIVTALRRTELERIFVLACDMPLLDVETIHQVIAASSGHEAAIPRHEGRAAYLLAVYARSLLGPMEDYLQAGKRSMESFCKTLSDVAWVPVTGPSASNVNTKQDLERLEAEHVE